MQSTPKDSKLIPGWSPNNFSDPHLLDRQGTYDEKSFQNIYLILSLWPKTVESIYIYTVYIYICMSQRHIFFSAHHHCISAFGQVRPPAILAAFLLPGSAATCPSHTSTGKTHKCLIRLQKENIWYLYIYICISKYIYETIYIYIYII